jgi:KaiC/GvpD/RAD55 family RecA-like ATPase
MINTDTHQISAFIKMLHDAAAPLQGKGKLCVVSITHHADDSSAPITETAMFNIGDHQKTIAWIEANQANGRNFYAPLAVYALDAERQKTENVIAVLGTIADFDDTNAASYRDRLPAMPDFVTETSPGRYQAGFIFEHPQEDMSKAKALATTLRDFAHCDDCTTNINQLWRIPGTVNYPNSKKIAKGRNPAGCLAILRKEPTETRTNFAKLASTLPETKTTEPASPKMQEREGKPFDLVHLEGVYNRLPNYAKALMKKRAEEGERSEHIYHVLSVLREQGISEDDAFAFSIGHQDGFMEKHAGHPDRIRAEVERVFRKGAPLPPPPLAANKLFFRRSEITTFPEPEYYIDGIIPKRALVCLTGQPGSGKSLMALDWLLHLATGRPWCGTVTEQAQGLYISAEGKSGIKARLLAWEKQHGVSIPEDAFAVCPHEFTITDEDALRYLCEAIDEANAAHGAVKVLMIDTVARTLAGDENNSDTMSSYVRCVSGLIRKYDMTVVLVHHTTKRGEGEEAPSKFRGHSSLYGALDIGMSMKRDEKIHIMKIEKIKDGEPLPELCFRRETIDLSAELGMMRSGKSHTSAVLLPLKTSHTAVGVAAYASRKKGQIAYDVVLAYLQEHKQAKTEDLRNALKDCEALGTDENTPESRSSLVTRVCTQLMNEGAIRRIRKGVWEIVPTFHTFYGLEFLLPLQDSLRH